MLHADAGGWTSKRLHMWSVPPAIVAELGSCLLLMQKPLHECTVDSAVRIRAVPNEALCRAGAM